MKQIFRNAFELSATERKSIVILVILIGILAGIQGYLAFHKPALPPEEQKLFNSEMAMLQKKGDNFSAIDSSIKADPRILEEPFIFDPNIADIAQLKQLGFNNRQIHNIIGYRLKGGHFHKKEDLKKIYGMDKETYNRLSDFVRIKKTISPIPVYRRVAHFSLPPKTDINQADTNTLIRIRGIGSVLSARIVRYRSLLGGFYSMEQLGEVYGLTDSTLLLLDRSFTIDTAQITKLNINTVPITDLMRHPYIGKYYARGIIRYREQVNQIMNISELKVNGLIPPEQFEKVKRYLTN